MSDKCKETIELPDVIASIMSDFYKSSVWTIDECYHLGIAGYFIHGISCGGQRMGGIVVDRTSLYIRMAPWESQEAKAMLESKGYKIG